MSLAALALGVRRPRLAFVGLGWIGSLRLRALAPEASMRVIACVDRDLGLATRTARAFTQAHAASDLESCLGLPLDGVVIATPTGLHEQQALLALEHGLAVFCQKPLAATAQGVERVIRSAAAVNRLLGVDFCYREAAGLRELRDRLLARRYGEIRAIDLTFHNAYAPGSAWSRDRELAGGGCLLDLGVHLLDLVTWLQDLPDLEVETAQLYGGEVEELAIAQLRQPDGALIRLACSWHAHLGQGAEIAVTFHGTRGGAVWRNVGGSFFDFELYETQGDQRQRIAGGPDEWGPRALREWIARLARSNEFDASAGSYAVSARIIDAIYARGRAT